MHFLSFREVLVTFTLVLWHDFKKGNQIGSELCRYAYTLMICCEKVTSLEQHAMTLSAHSYWCIGNIWRFGSLSSIASFILSNTFLRFPGDILDNLWCFDSDPNVVTYYGHENDDGDCCDCVGSNHLAFHWIWIVLTSENSPCWKNSKFHDENSFKNVQSQYPLHLPW